MDPLPATLETTWTTKIVKVEGDVGEILGFDGEYLLGKPLAVFVDLADRNDFRTRLGSIPEDGGYDQWRLRLRHADSSSRSVMANVTRAASGNGRPNLRWSLRLDRETSPPPPSADGLEEAIRHLAHDLNQPLAAIVSYARGCLIRAQAKKLKDEDLNMVLEQIVAEALRVGAIIREFRRKD